jgi:hypothetical protein
MAVATPDHTTPLVNPFVVGRPLTGSAASLYVGREEVFAWLAENLNGATRPNATLLYGRRRVGKTSTLYQLIEGERGRPLREKHDRPLFCAFIDLQRLAGRPTDEWLRLFGRDVCRQIATSGLDRSTPEGAVAGETGYAAFDRCLDRLEKTLPGDGLILLAVDEFEQMQADIAAGTLAAEVLPFLRSQIQHRARVAFVLCGGRSMLAPYWGPIVDLTARHELGRLTFEQTGMLIRAPLTGRLCITDDAVAAIWQATQGHPFLIQTIGHHLVSAANRRPARGLIGAAGVRRAIRQIEAERTFDEPAFVHDEQIGAAESAA